MANSQRLETVRRAIRAWLAAQTDSGVEKAETTLMVESFLIRDELFCGRRFCTSTHRATWFVEEDELKIHSQNGPLCLSIRGSQIDQLAAGLDGANDDEESLDVLPMRSFAERIDDNTDEIRRAA